MYDGCVQHTSQAWIGAASALLLAVIGLGCASKPEPEVLPPDVFLTGVVPVGGGLFEQRVRLSFRVANPNGFALDVAGLSFRLDVNGETLARGVSSENLVLPALGEEIVTAEASTTSLQLLHQLWRLTERRELAYELSGRLHLSGAGVSSVPFQHTAQLGPQSPNELPQP